MATFEQLDAHARSLPEVTAKLSRDGRPEYLVRGKRFLCLRGRRKDAIDPQTGEPMDDVLMIRTPDVDAKHARLAEPTLPLFTTPHFDGYAAVLLRVRDLQEVPLATLEQLVEDAWRAQAPKRLIAEREATT